jgi:ribosomal subunit interface protein
MTTPTTTHSGPFVVTLRGSVPDRAAAYAEEKVRRVGEVANQPVLSTHVVLTIAGDPARDRPAIAEATLDVNGFSVRAQAAAGDLLGAVDLLEDRLRRKLVQHQDRVRTRSRWIGASGAAGWRHGELPSSRPPSYPRPVEERMIVRRKTFGLDPQTLDEAAFDMDLLGHDFYLFTDAGTGHDALVRRTEEGGYAYRGQVSEQDDAATRARWEGPAPVLSEAQARARLDAGGEPFVFYLDPTSRRGHVLYRRYDGHYGLITAR